MPSTVKCPTCKKASLYDINNPARPFCSPRCKEIDLGAWASDAYVVEGASVSASNDLNDGNHDASHDVGFDADNSLNSQPRAWG